MISFLKLFSPLQSECSLSTQHAFDIGYSTPVKRLEKVYFAVFPLVFEHCKGLLVHSHFVERL